MHVLRASSHGSQVLSHLCSIVESMELGLTASHKSQVLSFNYDMDAYMATFFGGEA